MVQIDPLFLIGATTGNVLRPGGGGNSGPLSHRKRDKQVAPRISSAKIPLAQPMTKDSCAGLSLPTSRRRHGGWDQTLAPAQRRSNASIATLKAPTSLNKQVRPALGLLFGKDQKGFHKKGIHDQGDFYKNLLETTVEKMPKKRGNLTFSWIPLLWIPLLVLPGLFFFAEGA